MSIYTKTGDAGQTSLADNQRVSKADHRLEAYGTADELNAWVGMLRAALVQLSAHQNSDAQLLWIQNKLFNLGASLSAAPGEWLTEDDTRQLEHWIDDMQALLPPLRAFILPAGSETVARCHVCRTITRRLTLTSNTLFVQSYKLLLVYNRLIISLIQIKKMSCKHDQSPIRGAFSRNYRAKVVKTFGLCKCFL